MNAEDTFELTRKQFQAELDKAQREFDRLQATIDRWNAYDGPLTRPETRVIKS